MMNIVDKDIRWLQRVFDFPKSVRIIDAPKRFQKLETLGLLIMDENNDLTLTEEGRKLLNPRTNAVSS